MTFAGRVRNGPAMIDSKKILDILEQRLATERKYQSKQNESHKNHRCEPDAVLNGINTGFPLKSCIQFPKRHFLYGSLWAIDRLDVVYVKNLFHEIVKGYLLVCFGLVGGFLKNGGGDNLFRLQTAVEVGWLHHACRPIAG